jgi:hypothetical protein
MTSPPPRCGTCGIDHENGATWQDGILQSDCTLAALTHDIAHLSIPSNEPRARRQADKLQLRVSSWTARGMLVLTLKGSQEAPPTHKAPHTTHTDPTPQIQHRDNNPTPTTAHNTHSERTSEEKCRRSSRNSSRNSPTKWTWNTSTTYSSPEENSSPRRAASAAKHASHRATSPVTTTHPSTRNTPHQSTHPSTFTHLQQTCAHVTRRSSRHKHTTRRRRLLVSLGHTRGRTARTRSARATEERSRGRGNVQVRAAARNLRKFMDVRERGPKGHRGHCLK